MNTVSTPKAQDLRVNSPLFWFTFFALAAIIVLGINFLLNPAGASAGYGPDGHPNSPACGHLKFPPP
jgi:hypothetical protein